MRKVFLFILTLSLLLWQVACQQQKATADVIRVGTIAGPETELVVVAKTIAEKQYQLKVEIIEFSDYNIPNSALDEGSIDLNIFQHQQFLNAAIQAHHYELTAIAKTFIYPMGIYSKKIKSLALVPNNAVISIPNDPSNEARALILLAKTGLIQLKNSTGITATPRDIITNPKNLQIKEIDAAQLPRTLMDVDLAVINTNFAVPAGLLPKRDALFLENRTSPYANLIVAKNSNKNNPLFQKFIRAFQSPAVITKAKELFNDQAIAAW